MKIAKLENIVQRKPQFQRADPFPFLAIDDFLDIELAQKVAQDFPDMNNDRLFVYKNPLEDKVALNDWNAFPPTTYQLLQYLNSDVVVKALSELIGVKLVADNGLHGGGWHMHSSGGRLNPHLDYSIHPKIGLQRKINLIIYFSEDWQDEWGGHLGLWSHDPQKNGPGQLMQELAPSFNRAIIFDTTRQSWHGISRELNCPKGKSRRSLAVYYLCEPEEDAPGHQRALYAPTKEQEGDKEVLQIIKDRVDAMKYKDVYKTSK